MTVRKTPGKYPHIFWIDLKGDGVMVECAVLKVDGFGNVYYVEIPNLDDIDRNRLVRIVSGRNAANFELWDLMSQITLNNGINALDYFHQLVKVITPEGVIMNPRAGTVGTGSVDTTSAEQMASINLNNAPVESVPESAKPKTTRKRTTKSSE